MIERNVNLSLILFKVTKPKTWVLSRRAETMFGCNCFVSLLLLSWIIVQVLISIIKIFLSSLLQWRVSRPSEQRLWLGLVMLGTTRVSTANAQVEQHKSQEEGDLGSWVLEFRTLILEPGLDIEWDLVMELDWNLEQAPGCQWLSKQFGKLPKTKDWAQWGTTWLRFNLKWSESYPTCPLLAAHMSALPTNAMTMSSHDSKYNSMLINSWMSSALWSIRIPCMLWHTIWHIRPCPWRTQFTDIKCHYDRRRAIRCSHQVCLQSQNWCFFIHANAPPIYRIAKKNSQTNN